MHPLLSATPIRAHLYLNIKPSYTPLMQLPHCHPPSTRTQGFFNTLFVKSTKDCPPTQNTVAIGEAFNFN